LHETYGGPIFGTKSHNKKEMLKRQIKHLKRTLRDSNVGRSFDGYTIAGIKDELKKLTAQLNEEVV
jgi:protein-arginine kinase activator protein McsA